MITLIRKVGVRRAVNKVAPKEYIMEGFLEPGLVNYEDVGAGVSRLDKETIDAMLSSFVGCPVTIDHVDESKDEILNSTDEKVSSKKQGIVTKAWWNESTGKYDCSFTVDTPEAENAVKGGYSGSCAYTVTKVGPGGEHNAVKYDETILDGHFEHLALVTNPRYEDCKIKLNGKVRMNSKAIGIKQNSKRYDLYSSSFDLTKEGVELEGDHKVGDKVEWKGYQWVVRSVKENAVDRAREKWQGYELEVRKEGDGWVGTCQELGLKTGVEKTMDQAGNVLRKMVDDKTGNERFSNSVTLKQCDNQAQVTLRNV